MSSKQNLVGDIELHLPVLCSEEKKCMELEEAYFHSAVHVKKGSGKSGKSYNVLRKRKLPLKIKFPQENLNQSKKKMARREEQLAQLQARKQNIHKRAIKYEVKKYGVENSDAYKLDEILSFNQHEILPADELGIYDDTMYARLLNILEGDEITPEDYDLLLQLDSNNIKSTLEDVDIENIPTAIIGEGAIEGNISIEDIGIDYCEICLEAFRNDVEIRRLPCHHVFCKNCIDYWLKEVSHKCPNLSCYWCR